MKNIQRLGRVVYKPNWNGGQWTVNKEDGTEIPLSAFKKQKTNLCVTVSGKTFQAVIKEISGVDYDMGHTYTWNNIKLYAKEKSEVFGYTEQDLSETCSKNGIKVYLESYE